MDKPFGFKYEIKDQHLNLVKNVVNEKNFEKIDLVNDNRNLQDNTDNQRLNKDDIERMKNMEELSGNQIVDRLVENSASFSQKTQYSQQKYIKKKKDKYLPVFEILKPTIRTITQIYTQANNKRKIMNMRIDTLSQILTYSNLAAYRNVMVLESCKGILLSAIIERVGGYGKIVNLSPNGSHISTK